MRVLQESNAEAAGRQPARVTVVIPTIANYEMLGRVLGGFDGQTAPSHEFEIIVVADQAEADIDRVWATVGTRRYRVRLMRGAVPGASSNRNTGWQVADTPLVLFTDDDTVPVRKFVAEHLAWHDRHPEEHVAVLGLVRWAPGIRVTPFMRWLDCGVQFDYPSIQGIEATWAHAYTSNLSVKLAFLRRVGGYDAERLPYGYEDLDWGYRARDHGLRVLFNRRAVADHWRRPTIEQWQTRTPRLARSEWRFTEMHPEIPPWFWRKFDDAARHGPRGSRARRLAWIIPRWIPILGEAVWSRADLQWRQQLAPLFLDAWDAAVASGGDDGLEPGLAATAERGQPPPGTSR